MEDMGATIDAGMLTNGTDAAPQQEKQTTPGVTDLVSGSDLAMKQTSSLMMLIYLELASLGLI